MIKISLQNNKGFVLLFAVTFSSIVLSIALGVTNIAFREVKFGTNARDTNNAFFAADTGIESVLFSDKDPNTFPMPEEEEKADPIFVFIVGLGSERLSCAIVSVTKDNRDPSKPITTIISKGYNIGGGDPSCSSPNPDRIEREIKVTY